MKNLKEKFNIQNWSLTKKIFLFIAILIVLIAIVILLIFISLMKKNSLTLTEELITEKTAQTSIIYDRTGEHVLYEIHGDENRKVISHDQIPDTIRIATIAAEDNSFYSHHGIDLLAIVRALKKNIEEGYIVEGASTITQQLARNLFLNREKNIDRKIKEAIYAIKIERKYTKDEILDAYLNQVPYGSNIYGIETAAETYFNKSAIDLTLDEAAMLAAMTKATTTYSPYGNNRDKLVQRQKEILKKITELELENPKKIKESLKIDTLDKVQPFVDPISAPHFVFYVLDSLEKKYGKELLENGGLKIYTTLDLEKQRFAEEIIKANDTELKKYRASNMSLVAIDPKNGQVLTMVGSVDYFNSEIDGQVNVATRPRQPGSSFKPIVYAASFEKGFQPETLVLDAKTDFGPDGTGENYIPQNYNGQFNGVVSMRQALAMSLNIPAVKTLREVGLDKAIKMAHRLGITTLNEPERYGLSLVIGGGEVTLLDETAAFSVFANDGKRNPADPILKIIDNEGKVICSNKPQNIKVLDPQIARKINSILSDNEARALTFGSRSALFIPGKTVAAKTGTTQDWHDAWTVGYTPEIAVGVWAGNNDNTAMDTGADGSYVAAPIWNKFISEVIKDDDASNSFTSYEISSQKPSFKFPISPDQFETVYYKIASGKRISPEKAGKLEPDEVRIERKLILENSDTEIIGEFNLEPNMILF